MDQKVKIAQGQRAIPTYELGKPEVNPVFFEKRVYQGSSGKVYPVPFIDKVYDHKVEKLYDSVTVENDYIKLVMLPEIGGRIFEAQDKTNNDYNFFYQQKVIKPALVGLAGPWISGGVEFNWPQHHRPGTFLPTDVFIEHEEDGAKTVWMSEYDPINRMKGMHGIRIRPDSSLIELRGRLFNRTPFTQTFLWWANVAVEVHDKYQSFFPPDVHYVADHAVRAMSSFPQAENEYYGIPYHKRQGKNDLRFYQNIPVPTSFMVCESNYNFFGGYDFKTEGGFIHVANQHISPGKKQWTWGSEPFGKAWDRELTDEGGPYFELMAGVYTDNQPDFSYLLPYETKTFSQFWWSYKNLGPVQNANQNMAVRLEIQQDNKLDVGIAASKSFERIRAVLKIDGQEKVFSNLSVSPDVPWVDHSISIDADQTRDISIVVFDEQDKELIAYKIQPERRSNSRKVAVEPPPASELESSNELELIGEHLELYRHPTRYPEEYWQMAIKRDPKSYKAFIALGRLYFKEGRFEEAEQKLRSAIQILTEYHPNPATGEAHYFCGVVCSLLRKREEAYGLLYKATWNFEWRSAGYYQIALLDCLKKDYSTALEHLEASLDTNRQNNKARILQAVIYRKQNRIEKAKEILISLLKKDPLDQWANSELAIIEKDYAKFLKSLRNDAQTIIDIAFDYAEAGFYEDAIKLIEQHHINETPYCAVPNPMSKSAMTKFILAWLYELNGNEKISLEVLKKAGQGKSDYFFPSRIMEQVVLEWEQTKEIENDLVPFGLGNYYFNLKRYKNAIAQWEKAQGKRSKNATLYRNLGIAYWNTDRNGLLAKEAFKRAIELSPDDMRIRYEYDQLRKKMNDDPKERLNELEPIIEKIKTRDDFCVELAALYNFTGRNAESLELLNSRNFHPWEGGEGQVLKQYTNACLGLGKQALEKGDAKTALQWFEKSMDIPDNLGEKYHPLQAQAHINYWKGMAHQALGNKEEAKTCFTESANEEGDYVDMAVKSYSELTYYSALSLKAMDQQAEYTKLLEDIRLFALDKLNTKASIDYFSTSLPMLLVFEDDIQLRNDVEAKFLIVITENALGNQSQARKLLKEILAMNAMHFRAKELLEQIIRSEQ